MTLGIYNSNGLTRWGRGTHTCFSKLTTIGSDNGLSPGRCQSIIWTNAGILLIGSLGTNFNEASIEIHTFWFKKIHLKLSSGKWRLFCLGLNPTEIITGGWVWRWDINKWSFNGFTYVSLNWVIFGSGNGSSSVRRQTNTWTNDHLLSIGPSGTKFSGFFYGNWNTFVDENAFENVVCPSGSHLVSVGSTSRDCSRLLLLSVNV